jgi:hypothetical protein
MNVVHRHSRVAAASLRVPPGRALLLALSVFLALAAAGLLPPSASAAGQADHAAALAIQQAKLLPGDGAAYDSFGCSVAVSGDTAVVGAYNADGAKAGQGAAYVFVRAGASWVLQQKLTASDGAAGDQFGVAVALSADTALVAANETGGGRGAVYVFVRSGTTWTQQAKLVASDGSSGDGFGCSVALSGDTALVGAWSDSSVANPTSAEGSAYVFVRAGTTWTERPKLTASDAAPNDGFGSSVSVSGNTVLVGAGYATVGGLTHKGAAYVFTRSGITWTEQTKLTASDGGTSDRFGASVALDGSTALVGAANATGRYTETGAAYVFVGAGSTWTPQQKLTAGDGFTYDYFGCSVALSGDTALVGAEDVNIGAIDLQGAAYLFTRSGTTWTHEPRLVAIDGAMNDHFGHSVAVSGDIAVAGAPYAGTEQGKAYAFMFDRTPPVTTAGLTPVVGAAGWYKSPVTVTLTAADALSGFDRSYYRLGTDGAFSVYDPAMRPAVSAQGASTIQYFSTDLIGNAEAAQSATVRIDSSKPVTTAYKTTVRRGRKAKLGYRVDDFIPGSAKATVVLRLYRGKALKKVLKVPGTSACNVRKTYLWRCTLRAGRYTLKVYATDLAGNRQSKVGSARLTVD